MNRVIEFHLKGHPPVFMYEEDYENSDGPLMPTATHDQDSFGMGESYAHMFSNGHIMRHMVKIGHRDDLTQPNEIKA